MARAEDTPERFEEADARLADIDGRFDVLDRIDRSVHALSGSLARLERKLDRILALSVESRGRNRQ
jgi:hypothetical protein